MKKLNVVLACVATAAGLAASGCDDGGDGGGNAVRDLTGTWRLDVQTQDGSVSFKSTEITFTARGSAYEVHWVSSATNGTATLDTNTLTVTMNISEAPTVLSLTGKFDPPDHMQGTGTVGGYGGLLLADWDATR